MLSRPERIVMDVYDHTTRDSRPLLGTARMDIRVDDDRDQMILVYEGNQADIFPDYDIRSALGTVQLILDTDQFFTPGEHDLDFPNGHLKVYLRGSPPRRGFDLQRLNRARLLEGVRLPFRAGKRIFSASNIDLDCALAKLAIDDVCAELVQREPAVVLHEGRDPAYALEGGADLANWIWGMDASIRLYAEGRAKEMKKAARREEVKAYE